MKLLYDIDSTPEFFIEEEMNEATGKSNKKYKIKGVFSTIGEKNRNGRIYPSAIWEKEVHQYQGNFNNGSQTTLMEYQHPARTNVDQMEAVAKINKLYISGNKVMGEAVLLDNPKADQLKTLIDNGIKISVSSRGVGSVKNGIVEDFKLVTYDIVDTPSDFNATMNGMVESHQLNEGIIDDITFKVDESGTISKVCDEDGVCHMFTEEEIQSAMISKFKDALDSVASNKKQLNEAKDEKLIEACYNYLDKQTRKMDKIFDSYGTDASELARTAMYDYMKNLSLLYEDITGEEM